MDGAIRFLLAVIIFIWHASGEVNFAWGPFATVGFMMISGYSAAILLFNQGYSLRLKDYLLSRVVRVYPPYFYVLMVTLLFLWFSGQSFPTISQLIRDFMLIGLNLQSPWSDHYRGMIVPQAWFLALLLQFYGVAWFVWKMGRWQRLIAGASMGVFMLAAFGYLEKLRWGYLLFPGTYFIFYIGRVIYDLDFPSSAEARRAARNTLILLWSWVALLVVLLFAFTPRQMAEYFVIEELFGILVGMPFLVVGLRRIRSSGLQVLLGGLSYPFYLSHELILSYLRYTFHIGGKGLLVLAFLLTLCLSLLVYVAVELPKRLSKERSS